MQQDNFIHGDLHPGNIFVRFVNNVPKVVLLDVGMTAELNSHSRSVMLDLFKVIFLSSFFFVHYTSILVTLSSRFNEIRRSELQMLRPSQL